MGEYFNPLRRKFGVVTLVLAYVVMLAWADSVNGDLNFDIVQTAFGRGSGSYLALNIGTNAPSVIASSRLNFHGRGVRTTCQIHPWQNTRLATKSVDHHLSGIPSLC